MNRNIAMQSMKTFVLGFCLLATMLLLGCRHPQKAAVHQSLHETTSRGVRATVHESLAGQTVEYISGHRVAVGPCLFASRKTLKDTTPQDSHHVIECGAKVEIVNDELLVNQKSYGKLSAGAPVTVAHNKVWINFEVAHPQTQVAQK